jgi:hypothetical protein
MIHADAARWRRRRNPVQRSARRRGRGRVRQGVQAGASKDRVERGWQPLQERQKPQLTEDQEYEFRRDVIQPRGGAVTLGDVREPMLTIVCERCGALSSSSAPTLHCRTSWRRSSIARRRARSASMTDARRGTRGSSNSKRVARDFFSWGDSRINGNMIHAGDGDFGVAFVGP